MDSEYIITSSGSFISTDELYHHGIKGMKWGVRKKSYHDSSGIKSASRKQIDEKTRREKLKRSAKIGAAVVGASLAVYGGYKLSSYTKNKKASAKLMKEVLKQSTNVTKTASLVNTGKDAVKSIIGSASKTAIPKPTTPKPTTPKPTTPKPTTPKPTISKTLPLVDRGKDAVKTVTNNAPKGTIPKSTVNTRVNYDFESLMKANSDLLKRSMDDLLKGL